MRHTGLGIAPLLERELNVVEVSVDRQEPIRSYWISGVPRAFDVDAPGPSDALRIFSREDDRLGVLQLLALPSILAAGGLDALPSNLPIRWLEAVSQARQGHELILDSEGDWRARFLFGNEPFATTVRVEGYCIACTLPQTNQSWALKSYEIGSPVGPAPNVLDDVFSFRAPAAGPAMPVPPMSPGSPRGDLPRVIEAARNKNAEIRAYLESRPSWFVHASEFQVLLTTVVWSITIADGVSPEGIKFVAEEALPIYAEQALNVRDVSTASPLPLRFAGDSEIQFSAPDASALPNHPCFDDTAQLRVVRSFFGWRENFPALGEDHRRGRTEWTFGSREAGCDQTEMTVLLGLATRQVEGVVLGVRPT